MPKNPLSYNEPKARRVRRLASQEQFQSEQGKPLVPEIATACNLAREAVRFILDGKLPRSDAAVPAGKGRKQDVLS